MAISRSSARKKGKMLEKLVRDKIIEAFSLNKEDVTVPFGTQTGADIKLSAKAKTKFPFSTEIKARATFDTIYGYYDQAKRHDSKLIPLVVIKADYKSPLAIIDLDHLLTILGRS